MSRTNPLGPLLRALCLCAAFALTAHVGRAAAEEEAEAEPAEAESPDPLFDEANDAANEVGTDLDEQGQGFPDPFEGLNRKTLVFNQTIDSFVLDPIITVYRFFIPDPGRRAVKRLLLNLNSPAVLVNDLLQLEFHDAGVTTARFIVNTTVGVAGIFDVGDEIGLPPHLSDFGQTLARYGVSSGPFLIIPVVGPTTLRDGTGSVVDFFFRPTTYFLAGTDQLWLNSLHGGGTGLAEWDLQGDNIERLEESSIDFYAALRSAYYQNRMAEIRARDDDIVLPVGLAAAD